MKRKTKTVTNFGTRKRAKSVPKGTRAVDVKNAEVEVEGTSAKLTRGGRKSYRRRAGEHGGVEGMPKGKIPLPLPPTIMDSTTGAMVGSQKDYFAEVFGVFPKTLMD